MLEATTWIRSWLKALKRWKRNKFYTNFHLTRWFRKVGLQLAKANWFWGKRRKYLLYFTHIASVWLTSRIRSRIEYWIPSECYSAWLRAALAQITLGSTRHIRRVEPMPFGCVELVEQHSSTGSTRRARLARHVELDRRYLQLSYDHRNSFIV